MPINVTIVGMGDMALALCHLFQPGKYCLRVTKPGVNPEEYPYFYKAQVVVAEIKEALETAEIIVLAIPSTAYPDFVDAYSSHFPKNAVLVDVSNDDSGCNISTTFSQLNWVKAFYDNGATELLLRKPWSKHPLVTIICGTNELAIDTVRNFAQEGLGFDIVQVLPMHHYSQLSRHQTSLPKEWVDAVFVLAIIFAFTEPYAILRYNVFKGFEWFHLPLQVTNKAICWTTITGFTLSLSPGLLAKLIQLRKHRQYQHKHSKTAWILWGLQIRKPLGLCSLWLLGLHVTISLLLFNPAYYEKFFVDPKANHSKLNATGELSFACAILATALFGLLGICSLPSVASQMTQRSWKVGMNIFCILHCLLLSGQVLTHHL